jgi:hypothetical protein
MITKNRRPRPVLRENGTKLCRCGCVLHNTPILMTISKASKYRQASVIEVPVWSISRRCVSHSGE